MNPIWRYRPENIERLSQRYAAAVRDLPRHDVVLQFGVAGLPPAPVPLVAHVEMSLATAAAADVYAREFGFDGWSDSQMERALAGERFFLQRCTLVWTNTQWTAQGIVAQGLPVERVRICPPACGMPDPGPIDRDWSRLDILFVGGDWHRKGGPLLLEAFRIVRSRIPSATLTIIGCDLPVSQAGVRMLGYLNRDKTEHLGRYEQAYRNATVFCLPTLFDTTGIVFQEAAIYGLPVVMLVGQGREHIFPADMAMHIHSPDPEELAEALTDLGRCPETMRRLGQCGRQRVLSCHTWAVAKGHIRRFLSEACGRGG